MNNTARIIKFENPRNKYIEDVNEIFMLAIPNKSTNVQYNSQIKRFFNVGNINSITVDMIKSVKSKGVMIYMNELTGESEHPYQNANQFKSALSKYFKFIIEYCYENEVEIITFNPFATESVKSYLKAIKEKDVNNVKLEDLNPLAKNIPTLILEEITNSSDGKIKRMRDKMIINIFRQTGMRQSSLLNFKVSSLVSIEDKYYIYIKKAKGNSNRITNISKSLYDEIKSYINLFELKEDDQIIRTYTGKEMKDTKSIREMVAKHVNALKSKSIIDKSSKVTPHKLRGIEITERIEKWGIYTASKWAGHSNIETTAIYDNIRTQIEDTRNSEMFE